MKLAIVAHDFGHCVEVGKIAHVEFLVKQITG
jgi:hypothetical protein